MNAEIYSPLFMGTLALTSLMAVFLLAACGAPLVALVGERHYLAKKRVFLDKFAKQVSAMAAIVGLCTLPFTAVMWLMGWAGSWFLLYLENPDTPLPEFSLDLAGPASLLVAGVYALALGLIVLYWVTWKPMAKKGKGTHSFIGLLAALCSLATLILSMGLKRATLEIQGQLTADISLMALHKNIFFLPFSSPFLPAMLQVLTLCITAGGGLGLLYLMLRRNKEDYGRDYYVFAFKHGASWALGGGLLSLFLGGWLALVLVPGITQLQFTDTKVLYFGLSALFLIGACTAWGAIQGSKAPLRNKPAVVLAVCFLWLSLFAEGVGAYLAMMA